MFAIPFTFFIICIPMLFYMTFKTSLYKPSKTRNAIVPYVLSKESIIILFLTYLVFVNFFVWVEIGENHRGGNDALNYLNRFLDADTSLIESLRKQNNEYGYGLFIWIMRQITDNYRVVLWILYSLMFACQFIFWKNLYWDGYTFLGCILLELVTLMCILRMVLCVHLSLLIYIYLSRKAYRKALLVSIVATSIQISGIMLIGIVIFMWVRSKWRISKKHMTLIYSFLICMLASLLYYSKEIFLRTKYWIYVGEGGVAKGYLLILFIIIGAYYVRRRRYNKFLPELALLVSILCTSLFVVIAESIYAIVYRMLLLFEPIIILLLIYLLRDYRYIKSLSKQTSSYLIYFGLLLVIPLRIIGFFTNSVYSYGLYTYSNEIINYLMRW